MKGCYFEPLNINTIVLVDSFIVFFKITFVFMRNCDAFSEELQCSYENE